LFSADLGRSSNRNQIEAVAQQPGVMLITSIGITGVIVNEEEVKKVTEAGKDMEYLVGVRVNETNNTFVATLIADGTRSGDDNVNSWNDCKYLI